MVKNRNLEKSVIFKGLVSDEDLLLHLSEASFFVSATQYEGFGFNVLESMASGTIPIVNNIDPLDKFVDEGKNGFFVYFSNSKKAAEKINVIIKKSSKEFIELSKGAKLKASLFSWEKVVGKVEYLYKELIT